MNKRLTVFLAYGMTLLCSSLFSSTTHGYDLLRIQHPQQTWRYGQGTIEEAIVSIRPQGIYMEYGLYLTFSARDLNFTAADSVEVQFFFDLPPEAIVHDLWLWVDDQIMRALIMDRWTASSIYEDIVKRRRDPAILFKNSATSYELRIYPMKGNAKRKIKLTYLMPAQWSATAVSAALPTNLLRTSRNPLATFYLLFWPHADWQKPRLLEFPDVAFNEKEDTFFGLYHRADIPSAAVVTSLNFALDSPLRNGVYVSRHPAGNGGIYQLALLPSQALQLQAQRKVAVLFDYLAGKSTITTNEVLNGVKVMLREQFTSADSFNLIFSNLTIRRAGENWFSADPAAIDQAFANAGSNPLASYSNLPALLANGLDFVKQNGNDGSLLLITNSDQVGDYRVANPLLNDVLNQMNPVLPIHVADFTNAKATYYNNGGRSYYGNEYFYQNLTQRTYGNYANIRATSSFSGMLTAIAQTLNGFIDSFDLYTTLENGFCFGRYNLGTTGSAIYLNRPILQLGKFNGSFPFIVQAAGVYKQQTFSTSKTIAADEAALSDSLAEEIWTGNYIAALEAQPQTNEIIKQILEASLRERVLSRYTAFLALEPSDTVKVCQDCRDESKLVSSVVSREKEAADDSLLQAYPNPFNAATTLTVRLPNNVKRENVSLKIYNLIGQVVRTFDLLVDPGKHTYQFTWDGRNDAGQIAATGTYFLVLKTPASRKALKLVMMK
ncbi:T9SS type A sorting domain-containing protein [candidate division KSB1 bacterium]|nr:T9SS type A sorting domain-containing protein [candidate division KSB1 bacterium]